MTYVRFKDGVTFVAKLGTYSILPQYFWDMTDHKPLEMVK